MERFSSLPGHYAIWMAHTGCWQLSDVDIRSVDNRKFPLEQFIPDILLLRTYRPAAQRLVRVDPTALRLPSEQQSLLQR
ncbi:hypothetical protein BDW02DRAFT_573198 [Decorospora gaudefroyi]|uniref:Uncharacterized protein n=1 Tax=Decorospora gaudefroyi TaxID=184978 RepID=A0A6A5K1U6_9PLEO|nr:hypothetical protein BDW02DRAFT_573198 [Decorospora gaudefroyi]